MEKHETFREFYANLMDIVNSSFNLGERILNSKVIGKIARSLPEGFKVKAIAIEESKDVDSLKLDEFVGSLQTFEMTLTSPRKSKKDYDTECPLIKRGKKDLQVTWSDTESYLSSEKRCK